MDLACCLRRLGADLNGPCAAFLRTCGQVAHKAQDAVAGGNQLLQPGFGKAKIVQEHFLLILIQLCDFLLNLSTDDKYLTSVFSGKTADGLHISVVSAVICQVAFRNIGSEYDRLPCEQVQGVDELTLILVLCLIAAGQPSLFKVGLHGL